MEVILNWALRAVFSVLGAGAGLWLFGWVRRTWPGGGERWPVRIALGMLLLAAVYSVGHARLLLQADAIEAGRERYARFGDPRRAEMRRAEVRGWILDCTDDPAEALAAYRNRDGVVTRDYPLGEGGANLIGGGVGAEERDYTVERLFAAHLRQPRGLLEMGELHPVGTDLRLTLCRRATARAWELLRDSGRPGAVVVQDVNTGAVLAYAATGGPDDAPLGIKRYAPPGSVFKLVLAALWWEAGLADDVLIPCPATIQVTRRAAVSNSGGFELPPVRGPAGMLVPSCNTTAIIMALEMRERLGAEAFVEAYRRFGFTPYTDEAPRDTARDFWATTSRAWAARMSPPPSRIRISTETGRAEWAQLAIGQGPVDVTVIGMSRFLQAIGNDGVMLPPTLETEVAGEAEEGRRVMSEETAGKLQAAMLRVVDAGTARSVLPRLRRLRWDLGGKTGTAQVANAPDDGWFGGLMFDSEGRPRYSVVTYLQGGGPGGRAPAAIAAEMTRLLAGQAPVRAEGR